MMRRKLHFTKYANVKKLMKSGDKRGKYIRRSAIGSDTIGTKLEVGARIRKNHNPRKAMELRLWLVQSVKAARSDNKTKGGPTF